MMGDYEPAPIGPDTNLQTTDFDLIQKRTHEDRVISILWEQINNM
jgi:hypothetical protein